MSGIYVCVLPAEVCTSFIADLISLAFLLRSALLLLEVSFLTGEANLFPTVVSGLFSGFPSLKCLEHSMMRFYVLQGDVADLQPQSKPFSIIKDPLIHQQWIILP